MRARFVFAALSLFLSISALAGKLDVFCELTQSGDYGIYKGSTYYDFDYSNDPPTVYVGGVYRVDGTDNLSADFSAFFRQPDPLYNDPGTNFLQDEFGYPLSPAGGCDVGAITAQCYHATPESEFYEMPSPMCYSFPQCHLSVSVDSGGYLTSSDASGDYNCHVCVTLSAFALDGWEFAGWSGDVISDEPVISVCLNGQDKSVSASFLPIPPPPPDPTQCGGNTDWQNGCSPIVINFDGNGNYALTGAESPVSFDISASGIPSRIGWTAARADEAFLWLDRDRNGRVDNGSELFGTATSLRDGSRASNGFVALGEFDSNADQVIDERDQIWPLLQLWTDRNHDGISQPQEIESIVGSRVHAIDVRAHWTGRRDASGNLFKFQSQVWLVRPNGPPSPAPLYDIFFVPVP